MSMAGSGERSRQLEAIAAGGSVNNRQIGFESVYDGKNSWIVQLHRGATATSGNITYPRDALSYHRFDVTKGIDQQFSVWKLSQSM
jgi:hypothetical protein